MGARDPSGLGLLGDLGNLAGNVGDGLIDFGHGVSDAIGNGICIGGGAYEGVGGGGKLCLSPDGVAVCLEVGFGAGVSVNATSGPVPSSNMSVTASASCGGATVSGTISRKLGCDQLDWSTKATGSSGPYSCGGGYGSSGPSLGCSATKSFVSGGCAAKLTAGGCIKF